ncbi:DNA cytosine methyltransferase [Aquiflexum sp.]|uniref:DNA cytosine methyltransferase n=1 Tax=Aquiflexum sp. TaxID=1872584 RepID=UPI0035938F0C
MDSTKYSVEEASKELDLTPQQVRNLCRNQKIYAERFGKVWILNEAALEDYKSKSNSGYVNDRESLASNSDFDTLQFKNPIALSFFSGAMGLDIGLERAGFKTLLACEVDKSCRKTITKNKPEIALIGDIRNYTSQDIRSKAGLSSTDEIDLVIGGPPCQAFSTAGKRKGFEDERGNVFLTFVNLIVELNPRFAVIENVRGILSAPLKHRPHEERGASFPPLSLEERKGGALLHVLNILKKNGYVVSFNLYNTANFGTPQKRERVIIIASREGKKIPYLQPTHSENGEYGLPKWKTFREAIQGLDKLGDRHLNFPEKRIKYYKMLKPGQNWRDLPDDIQKEALGKTYYSEGGRTGFLRRLDWDKPSPTLVTHPAMPATDLAHPEEDRPLSINEYKRIQQFPDDWEIEGTLLEQYKQIGNAVPVGLGKAIGDLLINQMSQDKKLEPYTNFRYSRYNYTNEKHWEEMVVKEMGQLEIGL